MENPSASSNENKDYVLEKVVYLLKFGVIGTIICGILIIAYTYGYIEKLSNMAGKGDTYNDVNCRFQGGEWVIRKCGLLDVCDKTENHYGCKNSCIEGAYCKK